MEENREIIDVTPKTEQKTRKHLPEWAKTALKVGAGILTGGGIVWLLCRSEKEVDDPYDGYPMTTSDDDQYMNN